jgi:hypothetical protein
MKEIIPVRLSYSSAELLQNCERRYFHHKVANTPNDSDYEEPEVFGTGKAFHHSLELLKHNPLSTPEIILGNVKKACEKEKVTEEQGLIHAMVLAYLGMHQVSGLNFVDAELEVSTNDFIGYIDAVMVDELGFWWIVDLKTKARLDDAVSPRLGKDFQLNLYLSFREEIATAVWKRTGIKLDPEKCGGCRYRIVTKSTAVQSGRETYDQYVKRLATTVGKDGNPMIKALDIKIPFAKMCPDMFREKHVELHHRASGIKELHLSKKVDKLSGEDCACQNFSYCNSFFRPCPFWSRCYGLTFTECGGLYEVNTKETYQQIKEDQGIF